MRSIRVLVALLLICLTSAAMLAEGKAADLASPTCSVKLGAMQLTGITADQTQHRYQIGVDPHTKGSVRLQLALLDSRSRVASRATTGAFDAAGGSAVMEIWSPIPLAAVKVEGVMRAGADAIACDAGTSLADADHAAPTLTVFAHDRDLAAGARVSVSVVLDARMLTRPQPVYPEFAIQQGLFGDVVVLVTIGPKGALQNASVYRTSDNPLLDAAALQAAERSSFSAPMRNGDPTTADYLIVYLFRVQGMQITDPCGASIRGFHLAHVSDQLHGALFRISIDSSDSNISSAELGFYSSQSRNGVLLDLPQIVFEKPDSNAGLIPVADASKNAEVLWLGPPVNYAALQSVVALDGKSRPCHDPWVHALNGDGHAVVASAAPDAEMGAAHAWLVLPARYDQRVVPAYPVVESDADHGGCADLIVHVRNDGSADRVEVVSGSGHDELDLTATAAATTSRYRATIRNGAAQTEYYSATYCFAAHP
jgi:TonB family protein